MKINIVNKDTPIFSQPYFNVSVPEGIASVGKTLLKLNATSINGNLLGYRIVSGDGDSLFWIKFLTGNIVNFFFISYSIKFKKFVFKFRRINCSKTVRSRKFGDAPFKTSSRRYFH